MATKRSRRMPSPSAGANTPLCDEVERLFQKERFKDAVKQAKLCYKEENTPANHRLLERAYFLRARQLIQLGMTASAVEVARHLLEFGVTANEWVDELVRLLMNLGLTRDAYQIQERLGTQELKDGLAAIAADQAVVHPERALDVSPEIGRDASLIRASLERLQASDEAGALSLLRDLVRSSPLSEWKFFVRGLAAHYRHDTEEARANWDRLDSTRKASAIAQRLRRLAEAQAANADERFLERIEKVVFGEPLLARLRQVSSLAAAQDWHTLFIEIAFLRHGLRRVDPKHPGRLTSILVGPVIKQARDLNPDDVADLLDRFTSAAEPMSIDPHWNRCRAIAWEEADADPDISRGRWAAFIDDLKTMPALSLAERALAQAMIWNHLAKTWHDEADAIDEESSQPFAPSIGPGRRRRDSEDARRLAGAKEKVIECLEKSIELAPLHLPTYRLLVDVNQKRDDPAGIESAARRLLAKFPDDVETIMLLARHSYERDDHVEALALAQKARQLKPLDDSLRNLEFACRIGLARKLALEARWDDGRDQFRVADELCPDESHHYFYLARRAMFEAKAGQSGPSDQMIREAEASLVEPTPLWLALSIESIRYRMPKATQDHYAELWNAGLQKKCRSNTAGELAALLDAFLDDRKEYPGRAGHIAQVVDYLERGSRLKYRLEDIERICEFLRHFPQQAKLLEKRVNQGLKQHPGSARLNFRAGLLELEKGRLPFASPKARQYLETALKLAQASTMPREAALLPPIQSALTLVNEMTAGPMGMPAFGDAGFPFPFSFPGGGFGPFGFPDDFDDDAWDEDDDDDDDDDGFFPDWSPSPRPSAPRKTGKRKPRKKR